MAYAVASFIALVGCGDDPTSSREPAALAIVSGNNQSGVVGDTLSMPLSVLLTDSKGRLSEGHRVDFTVVEGDARVDPQTVVTDETGHARTVVILGNSSGTVIVEATAFGVDEAVARFSASSMDLPPSSIRIEDGDEQVGIIGSPLPNSLVVVVLDERDDPVQGITVQFEVISGDATVMASSDTTDSLGKARAQVILGMDPGNIGLQATVSSIGAVVNFVAASVDTSRQGGETVTSMLLAGDYASAMFISASPTTLGASESISVLFSAEGLKGVRQFEMRVSPEPASAFDVDDAVFAATQPFVTPFASGIQLEGGTMRIGGASLGGGVDGDAELGRLTIRMSSNFNESTDARLLVTVLSIGPSSSMRDEYSAFDPELGVTITGARNVDSEVPVIYDDASLAASDTTVTGSGLAYIELATGTGAEVGRGSVVSVHYTGLLQDGTVFDSSYPRGAPFRFTVGQGTVIAGWDEGLALMTEGGRARLIVPSALAYGARGAGNVVPPNATIVFDIWLVDVE